MAKKSQKEENPARVVELDRESVELRRPTVITGIQRWRGDSVEVYPFQRRHLVDAGYVEGDDEDIASPAEIAQGNLEALKAPEEQEGYISDEELWNRGYGVGSEGEGVVAGEEGSNVSGDAKSQD